MIPGYWQRQLDSGAWEAPYPLAEAVPVIFREIAGARDETQLRELQRHWGPLILPTSQREDLEPAHPLIDLIPKPWRTVVREANRLRCAVNLWDAIDSGDCGALKRFVQPGPSGDPSWWFSPPDEFGIARELIASNEGSNADDSAVGSKRFAGIEPERPEFVSEEDLSQWLAANDVWRRAARFALGDLCARYGSRHPTDVRMTTDGQHMQMSVLPSSPLAAGWYGLTLVSTGGLIAPHRCERPSCLRWIAGDRRGDIRYCSTKCRSAHYKWLKRREAGIREVRVRRSVIRPKGSAPDHP